MARYMLIIILVYGVLSSGYICGANDKFGNSMSDCIHQSVTKKDDCKLNDQYRTLDGSCNNLKSPINGAAFTPLRRLLPPWYADNDGIDEPIGFPGSRVQNTVPTPHEVARKLFKTKQNNHNDNLLSSLHMAFGQFLDHDLSLTAKNGKADCASKKICQLRDFKYPCFPIKKAWNGQKGCTKFIRSKAICISETTNASAREQVNVVSSFIDASMVYGVDSKRLNRIRRLKKFHDGKLIITKDSFLPFDPHSENDCNTRGGCFLAGDIRVDEHIALVSFHTLFVREHNRIAEYLGQAHLDWSGEKIFQTARKIVGAIIQHITYSGYVPTLTDLDKYKGYNNSVDASISNAFSTAAFRFGHSQIRDSWAQLNKNFDQMLPNIPLRETFFNNTILFDVGIEPTFFGLMANQSQDVDLTFAPGVAKYLFQAPGKAPLNSLTAINIQRGRDHGLPGYNDWRAKCGLKKAKSFTQFKEIPKNHQLILKKLYGNVDNHIDLFAAGLAEKHVENKIVGPVFSCIIKEQFEALRDGDRFYYESDDVFTKAQLNEIKKITLAKVLCDNLKEITSIHENVFKAFKVGVTKRFECNGLPGVDLSYW